MTSAFEQPSESARAQQPQNSATPAAAAILEARGLTAGYGDMAAVRDVNLTVGAGEIVALLGPNGAGKTTTIMALAGILRPIHGEVRWKGTPTTAPLHQRVRDGLTFVPEERSLFMRLSVRDNLRIGRGGVAAAAEFFPEIGPLLDRRAGLLSGGEQQIVTLARALAFRPAALMVDELSLGLAPVVLVRLLAALKQAAREQQVALLLVEQQARRALTVADRWYLLREGSVIDQGDAGAGIDALERGYLSTTQQHGNTGT
jgi:branched-chain amino acid transport system ATP-binding protein